MGSQLEIRGPDSTDLIATVDLSKWLTDIENWQRLGGYCNDVYTVN